MVNWHLCYFDERVLCLYTPFSADKKSGRWDRLRRDVSPLTPTFCPPRPDEGVEIYPKCILSWHLLPYTTTNGWRFACVLSRRWGPQSLLLLTVNRWFERLCQKDVLYWRPLPMSGIGYTVPEGDKNSSKTCKIFIYKGLKNIRETS